jgi:hypothetical protein
MIAIARMKSLSIVAPSLAKLTAKHFLRRAFVAVCPVVRAKILEASQDFAEAS